MPKITKQHLKGVVLTVTLGFMLFFMAPCIFVGSLAHRGPLSLTQNPASSSPIFYITTIILENAKISKKRQKKLTAPYINNYLNAQKISRLMQDIKAWYIRQGYPTTTVTLPPNQNLQKGTLRLTIMHGFVEDIQFDQQTWRHRMQVFTAFPFLKGKPLHLKSLAQGIDQLNTLASNQATLKILPGKFTAGSLVQVQNTVTHPVKLDIGLDNQGNPQQRHIAL